MDALLAAIESVIFRNLRSARLLIPYDRGDIVSYLSEKTPVSARAYTEDGVALETKLGEADYGRRSRYIAPEGMVLYAASAWCARPKRSKSQRDPALSPA
jgi:hypothetical protein